MQQQDSLVVSARESGGPSSVPQRTLYTGARMPAVGLGTFGSDHVSPEQVANAVLGAAAAGYRHFDCASVYGNEAQVGAALEQIIKRRHQARRALGHIKSMEQQARWEDVIESCRQSLK